MGNITRPGNAKVKGIKKDRGLSSVFWWPRQESNLNLELRKLLYYPLYYEAGITGRQGRKGKDCPCTCVTILKKN